MASVVQLDREPTVASVQRPNRRPTPSSEMNGRLLVVATPPGEFTYPGPKAVGLTTTVGRQGRQPCTETPRPADHPAREPANAVNRIALSGSGGRAATSVPRPAVAVPLAPIGHEATGRAPRVRCGAEDRSGAGLGTPRV